MGVGSFIITTSDATSESLASSSCTCELFLSKGLSFQRRSVSTTALTLLSWKLGLPSVLFCFSCQGPIGKEWGCSASQGD
jgi:hypothetical protein